MKPVDVLGDQPLHISSPLQPGQRDVGRIGFRGREHAHALRVEGPESPWILPKCGYCGHLHGIHFLPNTRAGTAKVRDPRIGGNTCTRKKDGKARPLKKLRYPLYTLHHAESLSANRKRIETSRDVRTQLLPEMCIYSVSYTHLRAHETDSYLVCRLLLEKKKKHRTD